ncbi:hypothetical protein CAPTEDRAFT_212931 [Capitella teleta]|uniref:Notch ligand N-terminal domain-containing protein n=1 Tax=Capitella teleta TaxID=283909 RepID=R7UZ33_CAPTE|nr:hypothetical protein CAPTEDRAFT_212931 [Capitella teleta]|eukprot:ELU11574.1 hypothetical protein CAPTEDRAFT_212931 [Capitella teleta]
MVCAGVRILWLLLLAASPAQVNASGRLIIRFISYRNDDGEGSNGQCCDGRSIFCESQGGCDHYFIVSADSHFGNKSACSYGSVQTGVTRDRKYITFGDNIGGTSNPMVLEFNKWTGGVKIHIDVYDDDSNNDDHVDSISTIYRGPPGQFENLLTAEARTSLSLGVQVICDLNYYGDDCTHYCQGDYSEAEGRYTCED